jgi:hypothetical protein
MGKAKRLHSTSRRQFVKKAAYAAPAIITLQAAPSYAKKGSDKPDKPDNPHKAHESHEPHERE